MKKTIPLFLSLLVTSCLCVRTNASTQAKTIGPMPMQHGRANQRPFQRTKRASIDAQVERVGKRLDLSEVQRLDLKKILENQQAQTNRLWNDQKIEPIARMTQLKAVHEAAQKQFRTILSREQRKKYDDLLQQQESRLSAGQASNKNAH